MIRQQANAFPHYFEENIPKKGGPNGFLFFVQDHMCCVGAIAVGSGLNYRLRYPVDPGNRSRAWSRQRRPLIKTGLRVGLTLFWLLDLGLL